MISYEGRVPAPAQQQAAIPAGNRTPGSRQINTAINKPFLNSPVQNRKMGEWFKKLIAGEAFFLERLTQDDWEGFIAFAARQGLAPVLYHVLKESPPASLAASQLQELSEIYLGSAHRNLILYHELGKVLRGFQEEGIPVIVLKGACLAKAVYENIALRSMGDVDLLVRRADLGKTAQVLRRHGYTAGYDFQVENEAAIHCHLPPMRGSRKLTIEVHWTIFDFTRFAALEEEEMDHVWARAQPLNIENVPCLIWRLKT